MRGNRTEILVREMKGRLCIRGTELKPRACVSRGGLFPSHSFSPIPPSRTLAFSQQCLPEVDPPWNPPIPPPTPHSNPPTLGSPLQPSQRTISEWPPLSMALSCCDLTAIKCQIKLMDRHRQRAEAYTTQWIIVMEWMMSWLCRTRCCSSSLFPCPLKRKQYYFYICMYLWWCHVSSSFRPYNKCATVDEIGRELRSGTRWLKCAWCVKEICSQMITNLTMILSECLSVLVRMQHVYCDITVQCLWTCHLLMALLMHSQNSFKLTDAVADYFFLIQILSKML